MSRSEAKRIAETISNQQIKDMLDAAQVGISDWTQVSLVNKGMSKGAAWNILGKDFDVEKTHHILAKTNMVREFGVFLSDELKPKKKVKIINTNIFHQNPIFNNEINNF